MGGQRIKTAKDALCLFIKSLPPYSKFNVISFGSTYEKVFNESRENSNKNTEQALQKIQKFTSDLGGTELYNPIENVLNEEYNFKYPRSVFILTDGSIYNPENVFEIIGKHNHHTRVHSFAIGSGASKYLVNEIAKQGLGSATIVADGDKLMNTKVIRALKLASKPAFTNFNIDWQDNQNAVKFVVPTAPHISNLYEEEPFHVFAVFDEKELIEGTFAITLYNSYEQKDETLTLKVDPSTITESESGQNFSLAAKNLIDFTDKFGKDDQKAKTILDASVKYSVLADSTAFFGKIKNKDKSGEEMQTISIPIKKLHPQANSDIYSSAVCMMQSPMAYQTFAPTYVSTYAVRSGNKSVKLESKKGGIFSGISSAIGGLFSSKKTRAQPEAVMKCAMPSKKMKMNKSARVPEDKNVKMMWDSLEDEDENDSSEGSCEQEVHSNKRNKKVNKEKVQESASSGELLLIIRTI